MTARVWPHKKLDSHSQSHSIATLFFKCEKSCIIERFAIYILAFWHNLHGYINRVKAKIDDCFAMDGDTIYKIYLQNIISIIRLDINLEGTFTILLIAIFVL